MLKTFSNIDVRDVWQQGIYFVAVHLQDFDFGMFLRRGIGHGFYDPYFLVSFISSFNYLFLTLGLFCFAFIPNHRNVLRTSLVLAGLRYLLLLLLLCFVLFFFLIAFLFFDYFLVQGSDRLENLENEAFLKKSQRNLFALFMNNFKIIEINIYHAVIGFFISYRLEVK